ncbi:helix-turn-helix domain-containing protein [Bacillus pseudomycoides]|uniref:helix-turn-helix domain-containing protein n=1 Tax=Bacillus pseudomycoides TaxID=64104 RepID=UPI000BF15D6B|nr:helix-turn-helix transcriptional regulator [Bacillus pseudomycoides]PEN09699.1 transcriptional regulator [Bacillus pseudomycoides]
MTVTIGSRIKEVRKSLKMKQNELAEAVGIHFAMISLYESNKRTPSRETVEKMAPVLNVSADYLMGLSEHKTLDEEKSKQVSKEAADLMEKINKLPPEKRKLIENLIDNF